MDSFLLEWISLVLRWLHLITGIAWIGASFYFIWLDNSLATPPPWKKDQGIAGELWAFHGGGIYEVGKYALAPQTMPTQLHWFKWEAYSTWITGTLLLIAVYFFRAELYLVGQNTWLSSPHAAIIGAVLFLLLGLVFYETLIKYLKQTHPIVFPALLSLFIALCCWLAVQLFSGRAAFLLVGALMATIMVANVFFGIIPAQKSFIKAIDAGQSPSKERMLGAKTRSVHNNYFTLPVLFCMISNHYAFLYGHQYNWLILIAILAIAAYARHFFNLRHRGIVKPQILIYSSIAFLLLIGLVQMKSTSQPAKNSETLKNAMAAESNMLMSLNQKHCSGCHAKTPTVPGFSAAPAGLIFESEADLANAKDKIAAAVSTQYMPLANMTKMTPEERALFLIQLDKLD